MRGVHPPRKGGLRSGSITSNRALRIGRSPRLVHTKGAAGTGRPRVADNAPEIEVAQSITGTSHSRRSHLRSFSIPAITKKDGSHRTLENRQMTTLYPDENGP